MLSKLQRVNDTIGNDTDGIARIDLTRDDFERVVQRLLTRAIMLVEQALAGVNLQPSDIEHVVLVGGSTRIPKVKTALEKFFGKAPKSCGNVDEAVALGAALFAKKSARIREVCNQSYGTLAYVVNAKTGEEGVKNSIVIAKNTPIPCSMTQTYTLPSPTNASSRSTSPRARTATRGSLMSSAGSRSKFRPNRPAGCEVAVTYSYDENQRVRALVVDKQSGRSREIAVTYKGAASSARRSC